MKGARIMPSIRQRIAASVAKHMRMHLKADVRSQHQRAPSCEQSLPR